MTVPELDRLRTAIDAVDSQLLALLSERARLARQVGDVKKADDDAPVYRPEREAQVIARLQSENAGPLPDTAIAAIWREVMSACRGRERRMRIAYLGPAGTFSEQALRQHFGAGVDALPCATIDEVFRSTEAEAADFGIVPVENSGAAVENEAQRSSITSGLAVAVKQATGTGRAEKCSRMNRDT